MNKQNDWNTAIIEEFRDNAGKVGGPFAGKTLLILHTIGAKSGQKHINPVAYVTDGDRFVIIASKGGAPTNPDWYFNIVANPLVEVEVGMEQFAARASVAAEPERTRLVWQNGRNDARLCRVSEKNNPDNSGDHPRARKIIFSL